MTGFQYPDELSTTRSRFQHDGRVKARAVDGFQDQPKSSRIDGLFAGQNHLLQPRAACSLRGIVAGR